HGAWRLRALPRGGDVRDTARGAAPRRSRLLRRGRDRTALPRTRAGLPGLHRKRRTGARLRHLRPGDAGGRGRSGRRPRLRGPAAVEESGPDHDHRQLRGDRAMSERRRLSYVHVVAALALFFALTSGALAARHYLISSTRQIKPSVLSALRARAAGPAG